MHDIEIHFTNEPGQLAAFGDVLGRTGVNLEGGGMWVVGDVGVGHFLVADGEAAVAALTAAGLDVKNARPVIRQRLSQDKPGQLGAFSTAMAAAGVNIEILYSNHDGELCVVVDDVTAGQQVSDAWMADRG